VKSIAWHYWAGHSLAQAQLENPPALWVVAQAVVGTGRPLMGTPAMGTPAQGSPQTPTVSRAAGWRVHGSAEGCATHPAHSDARSDAHHEHPQLGNPTRLRAPAVPSSCAPTCLIAATTDPGLKEGWDGGDRPGGGLCPQPLAAFLHTAKEWERKRRVCGHRAAPSLIVAQPGAAGAGGGIR